MRAQFRDQWCAEHQSPRRLGLARLCFSLVFDTFITVPREHLSMLVQDARIAWRTLTLRHNRSFALSALLTLALGIGAVTAIFSVFHAVLLAPLPYREPDRVIRIWDTHQARGITRFSSSVPNLLSWQDRQHSFSALAGLKWGSFNVTGQGEAERLSGVAVSAHLFNLLGLQPIAGRSFVPDEDLPGRDRVVMLSEGLWQRRYGADPLLIGRTILVNGEARTVIGIAPQDVGFGTEYDIWVPLAPDRADRERNNKQIAVLGRLLPGVSLSQAEGELQRIVRDLEREFPNPEVGWSVRMAPVSDWIVPANVRDSVTLLFAAVGLLLLVACANVASLQMARATMRMREMGMRLALGASRARLARQMVTESFLLATIGGACGLALAWIGVRSLTSMLPAEFSRASQIGIDPAVLLFALAMVMLTGLLFGLVPAIMAARTDVQTVLQAAGRAGTDGNRQPFRQLLVCLQLALATMLVIGAALVAQSFSRLQGVALGFQPDHLLTATVSFSQPTEEMHEQNYARLQTMLEKIRALPGVSVAGIGSDVPMSSSNTSMPVGPIPHPPTVPAQGVQASWRIVSPDYLKTLGVPLLRGRFLEEQDTAASKPVVISAELARRLWPDGRDPIGRPMWTANGDAVNVIGVVGDMRQVGLDREPQPAMYFPMNSTLWPTMSVVLRTSGDPMALAAQVRQEIAAVDRDLPVFDVQTMETLVSRSAARPRLQRTLLVLFAGIALTLGVVGVVGVISFAVARRTPELAVRLTLGATPGQVMRAVMRGGFVICAAGVGIGVGGAWLLGRTLASLLYEVRPNDPLILGVTSAALLIVSLIACWLPARRATRINPIVALRSE